MVFVWIAAFVVFLIVEAATMGLTSLWFAAGALAAMISSLVAPSLVWLQVIWFFLITGVTLFFTRPLALKYVNQRKTATNADRALGEIGIVTEEIDNIAGSGTVSLKGRLWTARSRTGNVIARGTLVKIEEIAGVTLVVVPSVPADAEKVPEKV